MGGKKQGASGQGEKKQKRFSTGSRKIKGQKKKEKY